MHSFPARGASSILVHHFAVVIMLWVWTEDFISYTNFDYNYFINYIDSRDVRIFASVFVIWHYSAIFCYSALFGIRQVICNRIRIVYGYHQKYKNSNLLLKIREKRICGCGFLRAIWGHQGLGSHRKFFGCGVMCEFRCECVGVMCGCEWVWIL